MSKRIFILLLAVILCVLCACNNSETGISPLPDFTETEPVVEPVTDSELAQDIDTDDSTSTAQDPESPEELPEDSPSTQASVEDSADVPAPDTLNDAGSLSLNGEDDEVGEGLAPYVPKQGDVLSLPDINIVTPEETPLMYDFIHSCLDWHVSIDRANVFSEFYIMYNINTPNFIYSDWYIIQDYFTFPPYGAKIHRQEVGEGRLDTFLNTVGKMPEERILHEGDWVLLLLTLYDAKGITGFGPDGYWAGFYRREFGVFELPNTENPMPFMQDGTGWPQEWVTREPYYSLIKDRNGMDMKDPWWDEWNYLGTYQLLYYDENGNVVDSATLTCTGVGRFNIQEQGSEKIESCIWGDIVSTCDTSNASVPGHYTPQISTISAD